MIRIAWTFDDGPTIYSKLLIKKLHQLSIYNVTWFISRSQVRKQNYIDDLIHIQQSGGEIAIHEIDPLLDSKNWLPRKALSFENIDIALENLYDFKCELNKKGIKLNFVRLPGGELSEIVSYLRLIDEDSNNCFKIARDLIDGKPIPENFKRVKDDYEKLQNGLTDLGLKIWNGSSGKQPLLGGTTYGYNSWQAECAGIAEGRGADNVTYFQSGLRAKKGIIEVNVGNFEQRIIQAKLDGLDRSLLILAHDTTLSDVKKIILDILYINKISKKEMIQIEFCTLTDLFKKIRT